MGCWEEWLWSSPHFYLWKQFAREYREEHHSSRIKAFAATFRKAFPRSQQKTMFKKKPEEGTNDKKKKKTWLRQTRVSAMPVSEPRPGNETNV